jgi:hypothetical protein
MYEGRITVRCQRVNLGISLVVVSSALSESALEEWLPSCVGREGCRDASVAVILVLK